MRLMMTAAALALVATPVMAEDWTGPYAGFGVGQIDVDGPGALDGDDTSFGVHLGYDYDFGDWVLGGEIEYDRADISLGGGAATVDNIGRAKLKAGYDFGQALGYAVVGGARVDTSAGDDTGWVYGLGLAVSVSENVSIGGELLRHEFSNIGAGGIDADADSINLRVSFRF